jgi:hypothetical protein
MKERSFVQRNKRVKMRELTDLVALRKEDAGGDARGRSRLPEQLASDVPQAQVRAFEKAGWVFQERGAGAEEAAAADAPAPPQAQVFLKSGGRLALGTNVLTVQLKGKPTEEEANAALAPYGCRVVESLSFAPGLFRVAVEGEAGGDALDAAERLSDSGLVEFAEPELIEVTGPRSP